MSEAKKPATIEAPKPEVEATLALSLEEYCTRKSSVDRRVELIGGFHHDRLAAGHTRDTEQAFDAELAKFANKPV